MARLSKLAVSSPVFGIASFLVFPLIPIALITGVIALYRILRSRGLLKGAIFASGGVVIGIIALAFAGLMFLKYEMHYRPFRIPTASMSPTIKQNERIMADLGAYRTNDPARGDIIIYELLDKGKRRLMCKRVVGLPGEELEIREGKIFVNGSPVTIAGLPKETAYNNAGDFGKAGGSIKIQDGSYYVLGDNPSMSFDSRQHGPVERRDIKGKYVFGYRGLFGIIK